MASVTTPGSDKSSLGRRSGPVCKDCIADGVTKYRPTPHGGPRSPRCVTHERARKVKTRSRSHELRVEKIYGITKEEYEAIYEAQGRRCAVCWHAKGISKMLAVDHEHNKTGCEHSPELGCRNCIRCLACVTCNQIILGRYSIEALVRAIEVKLNPPAQRILNAGSPM